MEQLWRWRRDSPRPKPSTQRRSDWESACLENHGLREGDVLTVWKLDRLGRNTQHVLAIVDQLTSRRIGFRSLTEGLHTDGPMGTAMLTIMAAFAQLERDTMIERTRAGLAAAAANGRKGGRPRIVDDAAATKARNLRDVCPFTQTSAPLTAGDAMVTTATGAASAIIVPAVAAQSASNNSSLSPCRAGSTRRDCRVVAICVRVCCTRLGIAKGGSVIAVPSRP
jgi:hypothetical protein